MGTGLRSARISLEKEDEMFDNPLLKAKNCIITPHSAWASLEARRRLMKSTGRLISQNHPCL